MHFWAAAAAAGSVFGRQGLLPCLAAHLGTIVEPAALRLPHASRSALLDTSKIKGVAELGAARKRDAWSDDYSSIRRVIDLVWREQRGGAGLAAGPSAGAQQQRQQPQQQPHNMHADL